MYHFSVICAHPSVTSLNNACDSKKSIESVELSGGGPRGAFGALKDKWIADITRMSERLNELFIKYMGSLGNSVNHFFFFVFFFK